MKIADLGNFTGPVLICGSAYGNLQALEALAALQRSLGIGDAHVIHTGDAVAYCADTEASGAGAGRQISGVEALRKSGRKLGRALSAQEPTCFRTSL